MDFCMTNHTTPRDKHWPGEGYKFSILLQHSESPTLCTSFPIPKSTYRAYMFCSRGVARNKTRLHTCSGEIDRWQFNPCAKFETVQPTFSLFYHESGSDMFKMVTSKCHWQRRMSRFCSAHSEVFPYLTQMILRVSHQNHTHFTAFKNLDSSFICLPRASPRNQSGTNTCAKYAIFCVTPYLKSDPSISSSLHDFYRDLQKAQAERLCLPAQGRDKDHYLKTSWLKLNVLLPRPFQVVFQIFEGSLVQLHVQKKNAGHHMLSCPLLSKPKKLKSQWRWRHVFSFPSHIGTKLKSI